MGYNMEERPGPPLALLQTVFIRSHLLLPCEHCVERYVQVLANPTATEQLVFRDDLRTCVHLMTQHIELNVGAHCRWSSEESE